MPRQILPPERELLKSLSRISGVPIKTLRRKFLACVRAGVRKHPISGSPPCAPPKGAATGGVDPTISLKIKNKSTLPPSVEEVEKYARSINFLLKGHKFIDFYQSKGWKIGKSTMKDWKAAVRTWKRRAEESGTLQTFPSLTPEGSKIFEYLSNTVDRLARPQQRDYDYLEWEAHNIDEYFQRLPGKTGDSDSVKYFFQWRSSQFALQYCDFCIDKYTDCPTFTSHWLGIGTASWKRFIKSKEDSIGKPFPA